MKLCLHHSKMIQHCALLSVLFLFFISWGFIYTAAVPAAAPDFADGTSRNSASTTVERDYGRQISVTLEKPSFQETVLRRCDLPQKPYITDDRAAIMRAICEDSTLMANSSQFISRGEVDVFVMVDRYRLYFTLNQQSELMSRLKKPFAEQLAWNIQNYIRNPKLYTQFEIHSKTRGEYEPLKIFPGDDIALRVMLYAVKWEIHPDDARSLLAAAKKQVPEHEYPHWIAARHQQRNSTLRDHCLQQVSRREAQLNNNQDAGSNSPGQERASETEEKNRKCVTVVIPTCRRPEKLIHNLRRFADKLKSENAWSLICDIIVIDDNSGSAARKRMIQEFPEYIWIFKATADAGHAKTLNLIPKLVHSRYMFYLEDDWHLQPEASVSEMIQNSLTLLDYHDFEKNCDEPLIQVLIDNRDSSGWKRTIVWRDNPEKPGLPYYVNEFGLADESHMRSTWPGFSLNPGIWDLRAFRFLGLQFNTTEHWFEDMFSLRCFEAGFRTAHFSTTSFVHQPGESAYVLNNHARPWESKALSIEDKNSPAKSLDVEVEKSGRGCATTSSTANQSTPSPSLSAPRRSSSSAGPRLLPLYTQDS